MTSTSIPENLLLLISSIVVAFLFFLRYFGITAKLSSIFNKNDTTTIDTPLIMSFFTKDKELTPLNRGKVNGMRYMLYITNALKGYSEPTMLGNNALIYVLQLPFNTQAHIVGISNKYNMDSNFLKTYISTNCLEQISLEGSFSDKCKIFAQPGQGPLTQYILDPKAMQFIIDFCADNFWEIAGDELTLIKTEDQKGGINFLDISTRFVQEIRPAIEQKGEPVKHEAPYGVYEGGPLPCPICKTPMTVKADWLECAQGHGILINGRYVIKIRDKQLSVEETKENPAAHGQIICPNCNTPMQTTNYQNSGVVIDSCTNCPFRWLDANEAKKIATKI